MFDLIIPFILSTCLLAWYGLRQVVSSLKLRVDGYVAP